MQSWDRIYIFYAKYKKFNGKTFGRGADFPTPDAAKAWAKVMRGKGVKPVRGGPIGDLLCRVSVETPINLTDKQRDLLKKFDATMKGTGAKHSPQSSSWMDGVKKFFEGMGF